MYSSLTHILWPQILRQICRPRRVKFERGDEKPLKFSLDYKFELGSSLNFLLTKTAQTANETAVKA